MAADIQLYGFWRSIASFRVRTGLRLKGLRFDEHSINLMKGEQFSADYDRLNPQHVLPTLIDHGTLFTQSLAILEYLDEAYPEPPLLPRSIEDRAQARALALVAAADSHPLIAPRVRHALEGHGLDSNSVAAWCAHFTAEGLRSMEEFLARRAPSPFAFGNAPGLADICIAGQTVMAGFFSVDMTPCPRVAAIAARCFELPAFADSHPRRQPGAPPG